jgi:hypothetical protein
MEVTGRHHKNKKVTTTNKSVKVYSFEKRHSTGVLQATSRRPLFHEYHPSLLLRNKVPTMSLVVAALT